jgi:hypothetical protein
LGAEARSAKAAAERQGSKEREAFSRAMELSMRKQIVALVLVTCALVCGAEAAGPPKRKPLGVKEREAILALFKAVDLAQETNVVSEAAISWDNHVLKAREQTAYVPIRLTAAAADLTSPAMYIRAVSRHDGVRASDEHSRLREWVIRGGDLMAKMPETVAVSAGEMPFGIATRSGRQATAGAAAASGALTLQERDFEKQKRAAEDAKKKEETKERDPYLFPFEEYYIFEMKPGATIERAIGLPPGEYDVFVALIDRNRVKTSSAVTARHTVTVPDFWRDELALSSLILARDVRQLKAPLATQEQQEHPYAFGHAEVVPVVAPTFTPDDTLTVVYQICNYGAPDSDLTAEYSFYRTDGSRRLFNRTRPQFFADADLPAPGAWDTTAFATAAVPLQPFPPGQYELEVSVRDRLTRATARGTVAFTVASGVR